MNKRRIISIILILSVSFNILCTVHFALNDGQSIHWVFSDIGPAVMQDSYFGRSPGLETIFGVIGDVPGGYSLYQGNPLAVIVNGTSEQATTVDISVVLIAVLISATPLCIIWLFGRRSYGTKKTH